MPPLSEQKEIADYLERKCGEIDSLKKEIEAEKREVSETSPIPHLRNNNLQKKSHLKIE